MHAVSGGARLGAVLWVLGLQIFAVEYLVQRACHPSYSLAHNYVSDLGAVACTAQVCSPLHAWLNASFILQGFLMVGGVLLLRRAWPLHPESSVALVFLAMCGVGVAITGLVPADMHYRRHLLAGTLVFVSGSMAILMFGLEMLIGPARARAAGWGSLIAGVIVSSATFLLEWRHGSELHLIAQYIGLVERIPAYGIPLWVAIMGASVLLRREESAPVVEAQVTQAEAA
jgi:hypothetical membrane protein